VFQFAWPLFASVGLGLGLSRPSMRMTIRPKVPAPVDLAHILTAYLKLKGVKIAVREELAPTLTKLHTDRADLSRVQTNNIRACDLLHKYLETIRAVGDAFEVGKAGGLEVDPASLAALCSADAGPLGLFGTSVV